MHLAHTQYLPVAPPVFALLAGALVLLLILIQICVLRFAYMQLGVSSGTAFFLPLGSLLDSYINIPIATLDEEAIDIQGSHIRVVVAIASGFSFLPPIRASRSNEFSQPGNRRSTRVMTREHRPSEALQAH
jgi:uncharacterized membrane protein